MDSPAPASRSPVQATNLGPILALCGALLASWAVFAASLSPYLAALFPDSPRFVDALSRIIFWGVPCALYLRRYWGKRGLEPLGVTFPLGQGQVLRALLLSTVLGVALVAGTATQLSLSTSALLTQLSFEPFDLVAPFTEELVFRGVVVAELLNWAYDSSETAVELRLKFWGGQLFAALLFVLVHFPGWLVHGTMAEALSLSLPILVTGLVLGFVFAATRSLWGCVFLHWLNNALSQLS